MLNVGLDLSDSFDDGTGKGVGGFVAVTAFLNEALDVGENFDWVSLLFSRD